MSMSRIYSVVASIVSASLLWGYGCIPREPVEARARDSSVYIDGLAVRPGPDARARRNDLHAWPDLVSWPDLPYYPDAFASVHCAPKGQSSPCYSMFKQALIECACANGGNGGSLAGCVSTVSSDPYGIILDQLSKCVTLNCPNLCANGGYDTFLECAPQKCEPIANCCYGDGA
jgi:hypothetical protein